MNTWLGELSSATRSAALRSALQLDVKLQFYMDSITLSIKETFRPFKQVQILIYGI